MPSSRFSILALLLGACASGPSTAPRHYPSLPAPGAPAPAAAAAFAPSAELQPLASACRAREPTLANALDDDCNGRIDGIAGPLALALAYPKEAAFALALRRGDDGQPERALGPAVCDADAAFCTLRVDADALAGGPYALIARQGAGAARGALVVAVQARGAAATYIAPPLPPDQTERVVGQIGVP